MSAIYYDIVGQVHIPTSFRCLLIYYAKARKNEILRPDIIAGKKTYSLAIFYQHVNVRRSWNKLRKTWEFVISYLGLRKLHKIIYKHAESLAAMTQQYGNIFKCLCRLCISRFYLWLYHFLPQSMSKIDRLEERRQKDDRRKSCHRCHTLH